MPPDLDRRTYDLLRLVDRHQPIGSIQLVDLMTRYGYDIKGRTIRLHLSELDEQGLTEKVPGKGRRLTETGRAELERGDIDGRLEHIRSRIASLTNRVTYDPADDSGGVVVAASYLDASAFDEALSLIGALDELPLGPFVVDVSESAADEPGTYRLLAPSSITLDGVLLSHGIDARLATASVLEYDPTPVRNDAEGSSHHRNQGGGRIVRYVDVISGEGSTIDVLSLLIEAGRTDVLGALEEARPRPIVGDIRELPLNQFREARSLAWRARDVLGGVYVVERPRERTPLRNGESGWNFSSLTYAGSGEILLAAFEESDLAVSWDTLYGILPRRDLEPVDEVVLSGPLAGGR